MDAHLKHLADTALEIGVAEEALDAGDPGPARPALERAQGGLAVLRSRWPEMSATERAVVGRAAGPVRARLDAALARLPPRAALSEGSPEHDADEDVDPTAA